MGGDILLPGLFALCAVFGVPHEKCETDYNRIGVFMPSTSSETDPAKWYVSETSWPDKNGKPTNCDGAIALSRYRIFDGSWGTTWACRAPREDDNITPQELQTISTLSQRLNSISPKTYDDHERAMALKRLVKVLAP